MFHNRKSLKSLSITPRTAMNEMLETSRVPSGHGFPATIEGSSDVLGGVLNREKWSMFKVFILKGSTRPAFSRTLNSPPKHRMNPIENPQPEGMRLANHSSWAAWSICATGTASRKPTKPESLHRRLRLGRYDPPATTVLRWSHLSLNFTLATHQGAASCRSLGEPTHGTARMRFLNVSFHLRARWASPRNAHRLRNRPCEFW